MRFFEFLIHNGAGVTLETIPAPEDVPESFGEIAAAGLAHERFITDAIEGILYHAIDEDDYRTGNFLQWFIDEQGEEEENARGIADALTRAGSCRAALMMLDEKLGGREA